MRRKRYFVSQRPQQNLDSFLDILTNTVGVLMFISLFITLVAVQSSTIVRTPLAKETDKKVNFFEITGSRVIYLDTKSANKQIKDFLGNLPECTKPSYVSGFIDSYLDELKNYQICVRNQLQELKEFRAETKNYEIELVDLESISWQYNPKPVNSGESGTELTQTNSEYRKILSQLEPDKEYLAFLVRPDSFATFRQAREIAWKAGFDVGWEPQTPETPIIFGSGGRTVGVQ
ncbi:hypothetical protein H6G54_02980 [Anabaena cylindrica FACHB-243]|uniref:Uncharacterized protein n=1 Tax=Anabaena cylindrica (strain ATCC 27899 / PCC 7122) TaxID=272123 RepID=K9ZSB7_ANACC|nr:MULTISPECIES: hypothetical protein [Anabaena]AFZ61240.1 hypothetical protein Anacy_5957 [Anabaena cylindrica PCC 7122]MBD2416688.1 hypothetical protein [Anabaena cylindrica FACHB-243]MBY5284463.1 hypothetical protein [Anabaena sp. CCAP 1446/1C]MBY5311440.1 hypothetical protein [Anabaena sp. CCAP 1446/1C]MCM2408679.1 hypothetical protein [Anabaena sp. CCAP 1446/1C]